MLKFYYNGIKSSDKEGLQKVTYVFIKSDINDGYIMIISQEEKGLSKEILQETKWRKIYKSNICNDVIPIYKSNKYVEYVVDVCIEAIEKNTYLTAETKCERIRSILDWIGE